MYIYIFFQLIDIFLKSPLDLIIFAYKVSVNTKISQLLFNVVYTYKGYHPFYYTYSLVLDTKYLYT